MKIGKKQVFWYKNANFSLYPAFTTSQMWPLIGTKILVTKMVFSAHLSKSGIFPNTLVCFCYQFQKFIFICYLKIYIKSTTEICPKNHIVLDAMHCGAGRPQVIEWTGCLVFSSPCPAHKILLSQYTFSGLKDTSH